MKTIMILDTETSALSPDKGRLLEVAVAVYSVEHRSLIRARSWLVAGDTNEAQAVNGIPPGLLRHGVPVEDVQRQVYAVAFKECEAIVAHFASFDRAWFSSEVQGLRWLCSAEDMTWPRPTNSRSLSALALAHGVGVTAAHRALDDVMTLVRVFDRAAEIGGDVPAMLTRALRPKATFEVADKAFDEARNAQAKAAGFAWNPKDRRWEKRMAPEDASALPFEVRQVGHGLAPSIKASDRASSIDDRWRESTPGALSVRATEE